MCALALVLFACVAYQRVHTFSCESPQPREYSHSDTINAMNETTVFLLTVSFVVQMLEMNYIFASSFFFSGAIGNAGAF